MNLRAAIVAWCLVDLAGCVVVTGERGAGSMTIDRRILEGGMQSTVESVPAPHQERASEPRAGPRLPR